MKNRWYRLKEWFATNIPAYASTFEPPATKNAVDKAEAELGVTFPPSVRQSYLIHNGEHRGHHGVLKYGMLQLKTVVKTTQRLREMDEQSEIAMWEHAQIPLFEVPNGDIIYVTDAPEGEETPVCYWDHECVDRHEEIAPSFPAYVDTIFEALQSGNYTYDDENEYLELDAFAYPW